MEKIILFGDSITDMSRDRNPNAGEPLKFGVGYSQFVKGIIDFEYPNQFEILNQGIGGNRTIDLYARIKADVWEQRPDYISILIGVNDIWHRAWNNGIGIKRFEKIYDMIISDTLERLPNVKIMLIEPFALVEWAKQVCNFNLSDVYEYAKVVEKLAHKYNLPFVKLQNKFDELASKNGAKVYLYDGVHPNSAGAKLIADEWVKAFKEMANI